MDDAEALRQQLRDEAAWRAFVEEELAREAEKARIWRERAEERAARIERLVAGRSLRQALAARLAGDPVPRVGLPDEDAAAARAASALRPAPQRPPRHPEVRAATLVGTSTLRALVAEFDHRDLVELGPAALRDADLAVLAADAWPTDGELAGELTTWLGTPERPPVVWAGEVPAVVGAALGPRDLVLGEHGGAPHVTLDPWAAGVPGRQLPRPGFPGRWVEDDGRRLLVTSTSTALAVVDDTIEPALVLGLAAAGIPVLTEQGAAPLDLPGPATPVQLDALDRGEAVPDELRRLAIRQRRWVETGATAALRATELLGELGVPSATHDQRLAVLLSSNKPDLVPDQLATLGRQARRPDEVRLALHGGADAEQRRAVEAAAEAAGLEVHVSTPDASTPLGTVLNDLAAATSAHLLAKIDDDDHYGPAHLLDAVAALDATGADLVGRKAHYVHLTGPDRTWLLAGDAEDQWTEQGVMGATFVWRRGLHDAVRFLPRPRRVDSLYVRAVAAAGAPIWALPANDFAYLRNPGGRTNIAGEHYVQARGTDVGPGLPLDVIDV